MPGMIRKIPHELCGFNGEYVIPIMDQMAVGRDASLPINHPTVTINYCNNIDTENLLKQLKDRLMDFNKPKPVQPKLSRYDIARRKYER